MGEPKDPLTIAATTLLVPMPPTSSPPPVRLAAYYFDETNPEEMKRAVVGVWEGIPASSKLAGDLEELRLRGTDGRSSTAMVLVSIGFLEDHLTSSRSRLRSALAGPVKTTKASDGSVDLTLNTPLSLRDLFAMDVVQPWLAHSLSRVERGCCLGPTQSMKVRAPRDLPAHGQVVSQIPGSWICGRVPAQDYSKYEDSLMDFHAISADIANDPGELFSRQPCPADCGLHGATNTLFSKRH